ncbi:hypothetical protein ACFWB0_21160 [Rhodococcus sp. NPDC060086]|uniref:hypothetical protein n=1 Tax=Rhodococcus sp. NPDC060086 TaxID=3347055 RepID=UPI003657DF9A
MAGKPYNILLWLVHGSWTTSFVQEPYRYLLPSLPDAGPWRRGRCGWPGPRTAVNFTAHELVSADIDAVILQRPASTLRTAVERVVHESAASCGKAARRAGVEAYGLDRFLSDWNALVATVHRKGSR